MGNSVMKVCTEGQLEHFTGAGWQLVRVFTEQLLASEDDMRNDYRLRDPHGRQMPPSGRYEDDGRKKHPVTVHKYLLIKSTDTRVVELDVERNALLDQLRKLEQGAQQARQDVSEAKEAVAQAKREQQGALDDYSALRDQLIKEQEFKRKLERDIGAIRKEIGEAAMKKILEGITT